MMKNRTVYLILVLLLEFNSLKSQYILYRTDTFEFKGTVDTLWLYKPIVDSSLCNPNYKGKGFCRYVNSSQIQSVYDVSNNDSLGFVAQYYPNGKILSFQEYIGSQLSGQSYYFDLDGKLVRIILFYRGSRELEYVVRNDRIQYKIDHLGKRGTKKRWCKRSLTSYEKDVVRQVQSESIIEVG